MNSAVDARELDPVLALTATVTERVIDDIVTHLTLRQPRTFNLGIYRDNLLYEVRHTAREIAKQQHLVRILRELDGALKAIVATKRSEWASTNRTYASVHYDMPGSRGA